MSSSALMLSSAALIMASLVLITSSYRLFNLQFRKVPALRAAFIYLFGSPGLLPHPPKTLPVYYYESNVFFRILRTITTSINVRNVLMDKYRTAVYGLILPNWIVLFFRLQHQIAVDDFLVFLYKYLLDPSLQH